MVWNIVGIENGHLGFEGHLLISYECNDHRKHLNHMIYDVTPRELNHKDAFTKFRREEHR